MSSETHKETPAPAETAAPAGRAGETKIIDAPSPPTQAAPPPKTSAPSPSKTGRWKYLIGGLVALLVLFSGVPRVFHALRTVSTDDAYVNSHVTFVAPRVAGQVVRVLVDDNSRVRTGDVLVELDPEPVGGEGEVEGGGLRV